MSQNWQTLEDDTTSKTTLENSEDVDYEGEDADDNIVQIKSVRTQLMTPEDFMNLMERKCNQIPALKKKIEEKEKGIESYEAQYDGEMDVMRCLDKEHDKKDRELLKHNSLTQHHMEAYKSIKQDKAQIERWEDQLENMKQDIEDMWSVAEDLIQDHDLDVPQAAKSLDWLPTHKYTEDSEESEESEEGKE